MNQNNIDLVKKLNSFLIVVLLLICFTGYYAYSSIYQSNVNTDLESSIVFIQDDTSLADLSQTLFYQGIIKKQSSFEMVAGLMKFGDDNIKPGRYKIESGWSNRKLVSHLRSGRQEAIDLTFNNVRSISELAGRLGAQIKHDSLSILNHLSNHDIQAKYGFNDATIMSMFIPNTYKVYWNTGLEQFCDRIKKEYDRFWNEGRLAKAEKLNLSPSEVYTLASIVEKETLAASEKSKIAGLYLNRLERGMLLQADPTVVYAAGDFSIRRVLNKHLAIDSPYNTYKYKGLPPGPIYMPDIGTIDATLSPEDHHYIFFCARPDNSGLHAFAKTNAQHAANARKYHNWLNNKQIYK